MKAKEFFKKLFNKNKEKFITASEAYRVATYSRQYTQDKLTEKLIQDLKKKVLEDSKNYRNYLCIETYSGYREKTVLPRVAEYFRSKNYKVELLNDSNYSEVNVLIINWQNLEDFVQEGS